MILEALVKRYENQAAEGKIQRQGWSKVDVAFGLRLSEGGEIADILDLRTEENRDKKTVLISKKLEVPEQTKRSSNVRAYFLCDKADYLFGIDGNTKCFEVAKKLHQDVLSNCHSPTATAVKNFFANWKPEETENCPKLQGYMKELKKGAKIVIMYEQNFAFEDDEVKTAWENYKFNQAGSTLMQCLITGKILPIAKNHPLIKGVKDAHSSGASIVSFNAPAFESYGLAGLNAPVSEYAAFAYTTALNDLISDSNHVKYFGDMTVVYWAEENSKTYQDCFAGLWESDEETSTQNLNSVMEGVKKKI